MNQTVLISMALLEVSLAVLHATDTRIEADANCMKATILSADGAVLTKRELK